MRHAARIILASFILIFATGSVSGAEGPRIKPLGEPWNFGRVKQGEVKEKTFVVKNAGDEKLTIKSIKSCCGYDVVDISPWKAAPNGKIKIRVSSDAGRKTPGKDKKTITIISNDQENPSLEVPVFSNIVASAGNPIEVARPVSPKVVPSVSAEEVNMWMSEDKNVMFVDVREIEEFTEKHIPDAMSIPRSVFSKTGQFPEDILEKADSETVAVVYCGGGYRASYIARKLGDTGRDVYNLEGGLKSWKKGGFDLTEGPKIPASMQPLEINLEEAYEHYFLLFKGKVMWIDVRSEEEYNEGHIKGAINIPFDLFKENLESIPRNKQIIVYCPGPGCEESESAARLLLKNGYKKGRVRVFPGGYSEWAGAGYPTE